MDWHSSATRAAELTIQACSNITKPLAPCPRLTENPISGVRLHVPSARPLPNLWRFISATIDSDSVSLRMWVSKAMPQYCQADSFHVSISFDFVIGGFHMRPSPFFGRFAKHESASWNILRPEALYCQGRVVSPVVRWSKTDRGHCNGGSGSLSVRGRTGS